MTGTLADQLFGQLTDTITTKVAELHGEDPDAAKNIWREIPVDLKTFVESRDHLHLPSLFRRQNGAIASLLGGDPTRIFDEPAPIKREPLEWRRFKRSSNVAAAAWHPDDGLHVEFKGGTVYRYAGCSEVDANRLMRAESAGKFLAGHIKPRHEGEKLTLTADEVLQTIRDPDRRQYQTAVLLWGKGSGKDYISSIVVTYLIYVLLCLRDPQGYFGLAPGEPIDILNVALNADQAKRVFFEKLKQRLYRWKWLRENYDVFEAGRRKYKDAAGRPKVEINDGEVVFPRGIRAFSKHSENESYEGMNVIAWVMDEASAFLSKLKKENASLIYQTLKTSAASRFGLRWVGFIISYPRHADDFTMQRLAEARANPEAGMYGDGPAATWEVNEARGQGEWVEVRPGHRVPVEFANDYILDFEAALARYECQPPASRSALIKQPERLWQAVQKGRQPLIEWEPVENVRDAVDGEGQERRRSFAGVRLTKLRPLPKGTRMYGHGDPARSSDAFAIALGHPVAATIMLQVPAGEVLSRSTLEREGLEPETMIPWEREVTRTVIDALIVWRPDPKRDMHVDLLNVREVLLQLVKTYRLGALTFDQYDSAETVQALQAKKLPVENEAWSNPFQHRIYRGARSAFYNDLVTLPDHPTITSIDPQKPGVIYELSRVEEIEGHKIDHPEDGSKDLADAVVRVIEHVTGQALGGLSFGNAGSGQQADLGRTKAPGRAVDPAKTPSPASGPAKVADAKRAAERPAGELVEGAGVEPRTGGRLSFGSGTARRY